MKNKTVGLFSITKMMYMNSTLLRNKKARLSFMRIMIVMLIISLFVAVLVFSVTSRHAKKNQFLTGFYAMDGALVIESLQAQPGDTILEYPFEEDFVITLKNNILSVETKDGALHREHSFHLLPGIRVQNGTGQGMVRFVKVNNVITLSDPDLQIEKVSFTELLKQTTTATQPPIEDFSAQFVQGKTTGTITPSTLTAVLSTIEHQLPKHFPKGNFLTITLASAPFEESHTQWTVLVEHREAEGIEQQFNDYFFSELEATLPQDYLVQRSINQQQKPYHIQLTFIIGKGEEQLFLVKRADLVQSLIATLDDYVEEENP